jgi:hypothetical protein
MMKQNFENEIARVRVEVHEQTLETVGADQVSDLSTIFYCY